jgi:HPt (histidine-containing phosphotransfer) domain-containing protein
MDAYLSKPLQTRALFEALEAAAPGRAALALDEALARAGSREFLKFQIGLFLDTSPGQLSAVRQAVVSGDAPALHRAAHTLGGQVGAFSPAALETARRLEALGQSADLAAAETLMAALERQVEELRADLTRWLAAGP